MIYADPKVGKSILSTQIAYSLVNKASLFDKRVEGDWKVLYIQADLPPQEWSHQLKTLGNTKGWDTLVVDRGALQLPKIFTEIQTICKDYNFIILDALVSLFGYPDLKSETGAGLLIKKLEELTKSPIWLIHHKRKSMPGVPDRSQQSAAGSFALAASVSTLYDLSTTRLEIRGRVVAESLDLKREGNGLWKRDVSLAI